MILDTNVVTTFLRPDAPMRCPKLVEIVSELIARNGLAISFVTQFEIRRGIEELTRRGQGRRKLVAFEKLLDHAEVLGLDAEEGQGWDLAARLWAEGRTQKPALVLTDADLLAASTALFHKRAFMTSDRGLADGLRRLESFKTQVVHLAVE